MERTDERRVSNQIMTYSWEEWHGRVLARTGVSTAVERRSARVFKKKELNEGRDGEQDFDGGIGRPKKDLPGKPCSEKTLHKKNKSPNTK